MLLVASVIFLMMAASGAAAVVGLCWAARTGQFRQMESSSRVIFDEKEPVGTVTDCFPLSHKKKMKKSAVKEAQS